MKRNLPGYLGLSLLSAVLLGAGCGKRSGQSSSAVAVEQAPATIQTAFRDAPPEVKQQAAEAVTALQSQNDAAAFEQLGTLTKRAELTPEQRRAAVASWMAVNQRLQQAAANGNSAAQELLEKYRASK